MSALVDERSRIEGCILGVCIGDALGSGVKPRKGAKIPVPVTDYLPLPRHKLPPGSWSSHSSMTLCLVEALKDNDLQFHEWRFATWLTKWATEGEITSTDRTWDLTGQVKTALNSFWAPAVKKFWSKKTPIDVEGTQDKVFSSRALNTEAEHSSLTRCAPIALAYFNPQHRLHPPSKADCYRFARRQSDMTHPVEACGDACVLYTRILWGIMEGLNKDRLFEVIKGTDISDRGLRELFDHYQSLEHWGQVPKKVLWKTHDKNGLVSVTLHAALWAFFNSDSFEDALIKAVNLGFDASAIGAVCGGLAGCFYGVPSIPSRWLENLQKTELVQQSAQSLAKWKYPEANATTPGRRSSLSRLGSPPLRNGLPAPNYMSPTKPLPEKPRSIAAASPLPQSVQRRGSFMDERPIELEPTISAIISVDQGPAAKKLGDEEVSPIKCTTTAATSCGYYAGNDMSPKGMTTSYQGFTSGIIADINRTELEKPYSWSPPCLSKSPMPSDSPSVFPGNLAPPARKDGFSLAAHFAEKESEEARRPSPERSEQHSRSYTLPAQPSPYTSPKPQTVAIPGLSVSSALIPNPIPSSWATEEELAARATNTNSKFDIEKEEERIAANHQRRLTKERSSITANEIQSRIEQTMNEVGSSNMSEYLVEVEKRAAAEEWEKNEESKRVKLSSGSGVFSGSGSEHNVEMISKSEAD